MNSGTWFASNSVPMKCTFFGLAEDMIRMRKHTIPGSKETRTLYNLIIFTQLPTLKTIRRLPPLFISCVFSLYYIRCVLSFIHLSS